MYSVISKCPVCESKLNAVRLKCEKCNTVIENDFSLSKFDYLTREEQEFAETFLICRGNIKEVERVLGISYPTVRSRLDDIIGKLGYTAKASSAKDRQQEIIDMLDEGSITAEEAISMLNERE